jgi:hypothetical protein
MPKTRHTEGEEPVWLFDRDSTLRNGWWSVFILAAVFGGLSIVGAFAESPWVLAGLPPVLLAVFANIKLRDVHTYGEAVKWLLLVLLGLVGSIVLLMLTTR